MSVSLDFSDMFRQTSKPRNQVQENSVEENNDENVAPQEIEGSSDVKSWVEYHLKSLNIEIKDEDFTSSSLTIWQRLLQERQQWQNQSQAVSEENMSLRRKYDNIDREKTALKVTVDGLQQDISGLKGKLEAIKEDKQATERLWLAEKNDLNSRLHQANALVTQYQGTARKKDKDYDRLQNQLAKMVKDSQRGQKSVIVLTKPLPKKHQENLTNITTLKDAELSEARQLKDALEIENINLRSMVNSLTTSFEDIQQKLILSNMTLMAGSSPAIEATPVKEDVCSPISRPCQSLAKQAKSTVKATRLSMSPPRTVSRTTDENSENARLQSELDEAFAKLKKAESLISEQESLIHAALIGKLPGLPDDNLSDVTLSNECDTTIDGDIKIDDIISAESKDEEYRIGDFLSPASPATMELLGMSGSFWSPVVPQSGRKK